MKKPKYRTLAEGFAAKAEDEQRKLDLYARVAKSIRPKGAAGNRTTIGKEKRGRT